MQACKLNLPHSNPSLSSEVTSLLFEPFSRSLALMHSDSSMLLFPSLSPFPSSPSPSSSPPTLIPPISTSACFLRLRSNPNSSNSRVLLVVAGPHSGGSGTLLRFWALRDNQVFAKAQVNCTQKDLICDEKSGVAVDLFPGFSVKLAGSVNLFALHSVSASQIWIFYAKMVGNEDVSMSVNLIKCAVLNCSLPICSITVSMGLLLLGEENGIRVFPLRPLLKGGARKHRECTPRRERNTQNDTLNCDASGDREMSLQNGSIRTISGSNDLCCTSHVYSESAVSSHRGKSTALEENEVIPSNGFTGKNKVKRISAKLRTVKLKQDSGVGGMFFVAFKSSEAHIQKSKAVLLVSLKVVSIHALSHKKFLVLDSVGDLHLLSLYSNALGSELTGHMRPLHHTMKVQMLAVLPDTSTRKQTVWASDGFHSLHITSVSDMAIPVDENDESESEEKLIQISATEAIFSSQKIQDLISLSANSILILGQGEVCVLQLEYLLDVKHAIQQWDKLVIFKETYLLIRLPEVDR